MKFFALTVLACLVLAGNQSQASTFNEDCKMAYREAAGFILDSVDAFKKYTTGNASKEQKQKARNILIADVASADAALRAKRAACYLFEDASNKDCVRAYSSVYKEVRERINLIAMATGNQQEVDLNMLSTVTLRGKLLYYDVRCK